MKLRQSVLTALLAAALCVMAPLAVPLGPVPVTLATLGVYLAAGLLGPWRGAAAVGLYLALGAVGVPVFAGFLGGVSRLAGPTGGFLLGYLPMAVICALFAARFGTRRWAPLLGMVLGTAVLYTVGTVWLCLQTGVRPGEAVVVCVLPFLPGDCLKMAAAWLLGPMLRRRLERTGLLER